MLGARAMSQEKRQVDIQFQMEIDDKGEMEYNTVKEKGHFFSKGPLDVIIYTEEIDGNAIKNLITIHKDKVTIKRTGAITMNQQFNVGRKTESLYQHPHGHIHMETYTNKMTYQSLRHEDKGRLEIDYSVKLNGLDNRNHSLILTYHEED